MELNKMSSKFTPKFYGIVEEGRLKLQEKEKLDKLINSLEGKEIEITVDKRRKNRTNNQNNWYWACVIGIPADHYGYTPDEMHEAYKFMFLRKEEHGKPMTVKSTASLSTEEFSDYVETCRTWAAKQGIDIPEPNAVSLDE